MHLVYAVEHGLWVGKARGLKLMTSPVGQWPIVPVLNDIVDRYVPFPEFRQRALDILATLVTFSTLPESQHPFRIERSLAGERTVSADDVVHIVAGDKIVVHVTAHFAPDTNGFSLVAIIWRSDTQPTITYATIGFPFYAELCLHAFLQLSSKLP